MVVLVCGVFWNRQSKVIYLHVTASDRLLMSDNFFNFNESCFQSIYFCIVYFKYRCNNITFEDKGKLIVRNCIKLQQTD